MSKVDVVEEVVRPVRALAGVKTYLVISRTGECIGGDELPRFIVAAARDVGLSLFDSPEDRKVERFADCVVVVRRYGDVVVCVIGDGSTLQNEVERKLSVLALQVKSAFARAPVSPLIPALREAYVTTAGPFSGLVFDRELEDVRRDGDANDLPTLAAFMERLAQRMNPPANHTLRARVAALLPAIDGARTTAPAQVAQRASAAPSAAPKRTTQPCLEVVQELTREYVGPLGNLVVQRALERTGADLGNTDGLDVLIAAIAAQIPSHKRDRFRTEVQGRIDAEARHAIAPPPIRGPVS